MTLLDILREVSAACGLQGDIDTVSNLKDIQDNIYMFTRMAYQFIQLMSDDWKFMNKTAKTNLTTGVTTISGTGIAKWKWVRFLGRDLKYVPYEDYVDQDWTTPRPPSVYTIDESNNIILNELDKLYQVTYKYVRTPHDILSDSDVPIIPARFHRLIVHKAAADFGSWLGNSEIEDKNLTQYDWLLLVMRRSEIPEKHIKYQPIA